MTLELNNTQFENLMKLAWLGNWIINANRTETFEEYEQALQLVLSRAAEAGLENSVEKDEECGAYFPTDDFEEYLQSFVDEYAEENFWDALVERLAERDIEEKYNAAQIEAMAAPARIDLWEKFEERYLAEFEKNGVGRLRIADGK
ncbi:MAG: hypothetical protein LBC99_07665 [Spirochaetota bacterium]|jgi:hypothetical protein|nr:hypothetical protein [Spirochaetota bacterium]